MKILFLSRPIFVGIKGTGEQVVAESIYKNLKKNKAELRSINKLLNIPSYKSLISLIFYDWFAVPLTTVNAFRWRPDIVLFASPFQSLFIFFTKILFRNTKTVAIVHDLFFADYNVSLFDKYALMVYLNLMKHVDVIITSTDENAEKIYRYFGRRATVINLGTSNDFNATPFSHRAEGNDFGYIGAYSKRKRIEFISEFIKSNIGSSIKFHFSGVISQVQKKELESIAGKNELFFYGNISEDEKLSFYKKLKFLYFPTSLEGFGLPILEAMKAGVIPVVHRDAEIPVCLKNYCEVVDSPADLLIYVNSFDRYYQKAYSNYLYSKKFDYDNYFFFLESLLEK